MGERVKNLTRSSQRPRKARWGNQLCDASGNEVRVGDKVMAVVDGALYPAVVENVVGEFDVIHVDVEVETSSFPYPETKEKRSYMVHVKGDDWEYQGIRCKEIHRSWE